MMSPATLLELAEFLAERIPQNPAFEEERHISWELVGRGCLLSGKAEGAMRAMRQLPAGEAQAALRFDFARWVSEHPESDTGLQILRETVDQISEWDHGFATPPFTHLTPLPYPLLPHHPSRR